MVEITEPMTMITDYIIAIIAFILGYFLYLEWLTGDQLSILLWSIGLFVTGIGALAGGTRHGFSKSLSDKRLQVVWKLTTYAIGLASLFILTGSIISSIKPGIILTGLIGISIISFIIYTIWMSKHNEFVYVIMYYVPSMLLIVVLKIYSYFNWDDPSSSWLIIGIILAFIGAAIQASGFRIHKHMNHNDIFHIIQMVSTYFLYRGALLLQDIALKN